MILHCNLSSEDGPFISPPSPQFNGYLKIFEIDYVAFDDGLLIGATEVQEIVDLPRPMNNDSDAEFDNETYQNCYIFFCSILFGNCENIPHAAGCKFSSIFFSA
ncbi:hypothetical protein TNCV_2222281 [Trichonephila clavipes]|nr:hypothetical protein TNCV_2222281 [Trichonephila clavipes]